MRREIFIDDYLGEDTRPRRGRREYRGRGEGFYRQDKGRGLHVMGGRRDGQGPHLDEGCNTVRNEHPEHRFHKYINYDFKETSKIKMFTSKKDLVDYVNKVGETGQQVDIFKIEEELYKVVVYGKSEVKEEE